jgi:VWFA-related protein
MLAGVLALTLLGMTAGAQAQDTDEVSTKDATPTFNTKVNLVMIPVVVRDRNGRAIGTLTKENFQLLDRGKLQTITRFQVEKESERVKPLEIKDDDSGDPGGEPVAPAAAKAPGAVIPGRFLGLLFDDMHMQAGELSESRNAARDFLAQSLRPDERVAVYTTSGRIAVDFSDDLNRVVEAMMKIMPRVEVTSHDCPPVTFYEGDRIMNHNDGGMLNLAAMDAKVCTNNNDLPAPPHNGGPSPNAEQIAAENLLSQNMAKSAAEAAVAAGEKDSRIAMDKIREISRRMASAPGERTLVLISGGFYLTDFERHEEADMIDAAIRAGVTINTLDARGLYTIVAGGDASQSVYNRSNGGDATTLRAKLAQTEHLAMGDVLGELADGTAGVMFTGNNDLKEGFRRVTEPPEFIYLLGFSPEALKLDGTYHVLKVSLNVKTDASLVARRGYYAPSRDADESEIARQEIREALYSRSEMQEIPIRLQTQFFKTDDQRAKLSLVAKIDLKPLRFRKENGRELELLILAAGVFDRNGKLISQVWRTVEMRLREDTFEQRVNAGITVKNSLDLTPGNYVLRVVLRDQEGKMMTARNHVVEIPY